MLVYRNLKSSEISMYQQMLRMAAGVSQTSINFEGLNAFVHHSVRNQDTGMLEKNT